MSPPRTLSLLLAVAVAGGLVAACGSSTKPAAPVDPDPPPPCQQPTDCPAVACQVASCGGGACAYENLPADTACDDGQGGRFCDGAGACLECRTVSDCPSTDVCLERAECTAGRCGFFYTAGPAPSSVVQSPNDCLSYECAADRGLVLNFAPWDVVTTTANSCVHVQCYVAGTDPLVAATVEQPQPEGSSCPGGTCSAAAVCTP